MKIDDLFDVDGKIAIVTGGSRGIGYMISEGLLRNGVTVYITSRKADDCIQAASQLSEYGTCTAIPADLSKEESLAEFVAEFRTHESHLDLWVSFRLAVLTRFSTST